MKSIDDILEDEDALCDFMDTLYNAFISDDEPSDKKAARILYHAQQHREEYDNFLMDICGWNLNSLLEMIPEREKDEDEEDEESEEDW